MAGRRAAQFPQNKIFASLNLCECVVWEILKSVEVLKKFFFFFQNPLGKILFFLLKSLFEKKGFFFFKNWEKIKCPPLFFLIGIWGIKKKFVFFKKT